LREADGREEVRWVEALSHAALLHVTPLSSAELFQRQMADHPRAWIFTSARWLSARTSTLLPRARIARGARTAVVEPLRLRHQALLYVPKGLPGDPNDPGFTEAVVEAALRCCAPARPAVPAVHHAPGAAPRARRVARRVEFPLLVQGTGSRSELLERFRSLGNAVLLGSQSFWEGVDVRGEALSQSVIDKLPFAPPDDPVLAARIDGMRAEGGNPFMICSCHRRYCSSSREREG